MTAFWMKIAKKSQTKDTMMLTTNCDEIDKMDTAEIMGVMPSYTNQDVLELGAGIG